MRLLDKIKLEQNINEIAKYDLDNKKIFGSSYCVIQNGDVVLKKHFGFTGPQGSDEVSDKVIYRLASMTKPVTAVAILILIDRGLVSLNDSVSKFLPEFKNIHIITPEGDDLGITKTEVTVLHCLTHTSGFGSLKGISLTEEEAKSISGTVNRFINEGLDFEPFTRQSYSAYAAFDVLAAIVEKVTGQKYGEFLEKEIFSPCNMPDTIFSPSEEQWGRMIEMHDRVDDENVIGSMNPGCPFGAFPGEHNLAGAGLVSTLDDYSNFAQMLLNRGEFNGHRIISEKTFKEIMKPHVGEDIMPGNERWGLGVRVITSADYEKLPVGTFGWSGAYGTHFWIDPENDICAVFMKNSKVDGGAANQSAQAFEKAVSNAFI